MGKADKKTPPVILSGEQGYVGFATLPDQINRKVVKKGFHFTVMVVGESGLGKSTFISSLFVTDLYNGRDKESSSSLQEKSQKTMEIRKQDLDILESGVKLRLTIIDTPGFGDGLSGEDSYLPIEEYVESQFRQYYDDESGLNRRHITDGRVHCLLYFLSPNSHGLKPLDVAAMKRLHTKVNIVPIIGKADTLTRGELSRLKTKILDDLSRHGINIYMFPDCEEEDSLELKEWDTRIKAAIPLAVIGSNTVMEVNGMKVRGRLYPWGVVEVENPEYSDFMLLRQMLIGSHLQDLKDVTEEVHYENFRAHHIFSNGRGERESHQQQCQGHPGSGEKSGNSDASAEVDTLLKEKELELKKMQDYLHQMQVEMDAVSGSRN